jgi:hypothetical protein
MCGFLLWGCALSLTLTFGYQPMSFPYKTKERNCIGVIVLCPVATEMSCFLYQLREWANRLSRPNFRSFGVKGFGAGFAIVFLL